MLVVIATFLAVAAAKPVTYDQRQDGEMNVRADVQNVVFLVAIPSKLPFSVSLIDGLFKNAKQRGQETELQERADVHSLDTFIEPSTPYRVEISGDGSGTPSPNVKAVFDNKYVEGEVVIAGRRSGSNQIEAEYGDNLKLLGAQEQCGPGRARDVEGICREITEFKLGKEKEQDTNKSSTSPVQTTDDKSKEKVPENVDSSKISVVQIPA